MNKNEYNVIVIGAGATGLMAAWELVQTGKKVLLLEAQNRIGGRIHTINDTNFSQSVELGAEFIHGKLEHTLTLLKKANIKYAQKDGNVWQKKNGQLQKQTDFIEDYSALNKKFSLLEHDISVEAFIEKYLQEDKFEELKFSLKNYVEGYYAADTKKASTFALRDELNGSDDEQYRLESGYIQLLNYLLKQCEKKDFRLLLNIPVTEIEYDNNSVEVLCGSNFFISDKVLLTVSTGVIHAKKIKFTPALPEKEMAAGMLGYGPVVKTILQFEKTFWEDKNLTMGNTTKDLSFLFSEEIIPTWWTQNPKKNHILTGWSGGPHALDLKNFTEDQILQKGLHSLSSIFSIDVIHLKQMLKGWHVAKWIDEPYSYGAYSYEVVDGMKWKNIIKQPILNNVFFAGEGLFNGMEIGTVEAAFISGRETAHEIIALF